MHKSKENIDGALLQNKDKSWSKENDFASIYKKQYCCWLREELRDILHTAGVKLFFS